MNERIQELLVEAHRQTKGGIYSGHLSVWTKKFAELIVRECANLFEIEYGTSEVSGNEVARVLQRHFGVKE